MTFEKKISNSIRALVGNTPLLRLNGPSEETNCNILGKAEFMNPGQSIKDRAALRMIEDAQKNKLITPGDLIVEGTGGNTGIGLTIIANSLGYKTLIVMPNNQSFEKIEILKQLGAHVVLTEPVPFSNPNNYIKKAEKISIEKNALWMNQFDNLSNRYSHFYGTAREIWEQTNGTLDAFICSIGTGGTISGNSMALKEKNKNIKIFCADPYGSGMHSWITSGSAMPTGNSIIEGIGQSRITKNIKDTVIDGSYQISDKEALEVMYKTLLKEGLFLGPTSGLNIAGAIKLAKDIGPNKTIVTVLCDYGNKYVSKIFNKAYLKKMNLPIPDWI